MEEIITDENAILKQSDVGYFKVQTEQARCALRESMRP